MLDTVIEKDRRVFHQRGSFTTPRRCHERLHQSRRGDTFRFWLMKTLAFVSSTDLNKCRLRAKACPRSEAVGAAFLNCPLKDAFLTEWEKHHRTIKVFTGQMIMAVDWLVLTWGVEQPPGDHRFRSAISKTGESHVAAFIDNDVLWHFVDAGWNCRHKKPHTSIRSAVGNGVFPHKPRLGAARWSFSGLFSADLHLRYDAKKMQLN